MTASISPASADLSVELLSWINTQLRDQVEEEQEVRESHSGARMKSILVAGLWGCTLAALQVFGW